jgi:hypothetical protein
MKPRNSIKTANEAITSSTTDTNGKPQKRTRHRRRNEIKDENSNNSRGRKKIGGGGDNSKKKVEVISDILAKPVIESSNPFFIAVCAPETYKPRMIISTNDKDIVQKNNRINVFLRQRQRGASTLAHNSTTNNNNNNNNIHSNRFIHHPALQQSREIQNHSNTCESSTRYVQTDTKLKNTVLELSNEIQFPSLGSSSLAVAAPARSTAADAAPAAAPASKLNFKEMVMRTSGPSSTSGTSNNTSSDIIQKSPVSTTRLCHKSLSSNNIFLAAFRSQDEDYDSPEYRDDDDDDVNSYGLQYPSSSSAVLIDSCDKKYDRLYN